MQVTKGTWGMRKQCVPGSLPSSPAREPGNEARVQHDFSFVICTIRPVLLSVMLLEPGGSKFLRF